MLKTCIVCGKNFSGLTDAKYCSAECSSQRRRAQYREQSRRYYATHLEKAHGKCHRYYVDHGRDARKRECTHREANVVRSHNRRVKLGGIPMTVGTILELKSEFLGFCPYCWDEIGRGHVDHIVPVSKGGTNEWSNLAWVCQKCNQQKWNRSLEEFRTYQENLAGGT